MNAVYPFQKSPRCPEARVPRQRARRYLLTPLKVTSLALDFLA
jgi:hypothetical protein